MEFEIWAQKWGIPPAAIHDLRRQLAEASGGGAKTGPAVSEAGVQSQVRLEAASRGWIMFRNNVGAMVDASGRMVRYGLANDSKRLNTHIKSADLVGLRPVTITQDMVGKVIGQFVSREIKASHWKYSGTPREQAQARWAEIINAAGGDARFCTGVHDL